MLEIDKDYAEDLENQKGLHDEQGPVSDPATIEPDEGDAK